jgi:hypothetical protein
MPVLDLSDCGSDPWLAQIRVLAVMHAPCDADLRRRCVLTWQQRRLAQSDDSRTILAAAWRQLASEIDRAVSRRDGLHKGNFAGNILITTLKTRGTVETAMAALAAEMRSQGKTGASHATLERAWSEFRPAAHLWAAVLALRFPPPTFAQPLSLEDLCDMFSVAEILRGKGECYRTGNQQRPVLDPDTTWRFQFPEGTVLRPAEDFPPLNSLPP